MLFDFCKINFINNKVCRVHFRRNLFGNGMTPSFLLLNSNRLNSRTDWAILGGSQSKGERTLDSKPRRMQWKTTLLFSQRIHSNSQLIKERNLLFPSTLKRHGIKKATNLGEGKLNSIPQRRQRERTLLSFSRKQGNSQKIIKYVVESHNTLCPDGT